MRKLMIGGTSLILFVVLSASAAERHTAHTWKLKKGEGRPSATLADAAWLVGSWTGTAFGKRFEEVWNPASAGSMVGMFKLLDDDGVAFYELMLITIDADSLVLKVKHFSADFTAWEERDDYEEFQIVRVEHDALHFGGVSFYRRDADRIDAYVVVKSNGEPVEQHLAYHRRAAEDAQR